MKAAAIALVLLSLHFTQPLKLQKTPTATPPEMEKQNEEKAEKKEGVTVCSKTQCKAGEDCQVINGKATCVCKASCPSHHHPVCGSDGITYENHCQLHRTSCIERKKISIKHKEPCKEVAPTPMTPSIPLSKPVVCYERDRDEVRARLIEWLRLQDELSGVVGYQNLLRKYFHTVDKNNDTKLDAMEFLHLIETNSSITEALGSDDEYINPILRGLCADALIAVTDSDADWELSFAEFARCLDPNFKPPKKGCELEGTIFEDGAEIPTDCNSCVCACGHWVCTALKCEDGEVTKRNDSRSSEETEFVVDGDKAEEQLKNEIEKEQTGKRVVLITEKPTEEETEPESETMNAIKRGGEREEQPEGEREGLEEGEAE